MIIITLIMITATIWIISSILSDKRKTVAAEKRKHNTLFKNK